MTQNTHHHRPLMVQAPVRALDPDGVAVVSAGTVAFAIAALTCWVFRADLETAGRLWYLGVSVVGTVLGLVGLAFGLFRKTRRRRGVATGPSGGSEILLQTRGRRLVEEPAGDLPERRTAEEPEGDLPARGRRHAEDA